MICAFCGRVFETKTNSQKYCSRSCSSKAKGSSGIDAALSPTITGAISELRVASMLLERGYMVFRNVAPTGKYDLVAMKEGEGPLLIDVKSSVTSAVTKSKYVMTAVIDDDELILFKDGCEIEY